VAEELGEQEPRSHALRYLTE